MTSLSSQPMTQYAFMLPVAIVVAASCQLVGIGGAALFSPIFLLIFPLLGPEYPLQSSAQAIASALLTEAFGFSSGLSGFYRRGLVDRTIAVQFLTVSAPFALIGAFCLSEFAANTKVLRAVYSVLMICLSLFLAFSPTDAGLASVAEQECRIDDEGADSNSETSMARSLIAADGRVFQYLKPPQSSPTSTAITAFGGFLTGLLGVGVGEVVLPQLVRKCCMPMPIASGTSVAVVLVTAAAAAVVQFGSLAGDTGGDILSVVPWRLVVFTIPGVLIGGQLAPALAGQLPDVLIQRVAAIVFFIVGLGFCVAALQV